MKKTAKKTGETPRPKKKSKASDDGGIIELLQDIEAEILIAEPGEKDSVAQIGMGLEKIAKAAGSDSPAAELFTASLGVLQAVYENVDIEAVKALQAIATAVDVAREYFSTAADERQTDRLGEATAQLQSFLGGDSEQAPPLVEAAAEPDEPAETEKEAEGIVWDTPAELPAEADDDLLKEYIVECLDHITAAESSLLDLESNPDDDETINTIFRAFHTIKGTSGFIGLDRIQRLAHFAETMLDRGREGEIKIIGGYADLSLQSCDALRIMIEGLDGLAIGGPLVIPDDLDDLLIRLKDPEAAGISEEDQTPAMRVGDILVGENKIARKTVEKVASEQGEEQIGKALVKEKAASATDVAQALRIQKKTATGTATKDATIRVGTGRLDSLINMVGELVIAQSMVTSDANLVEGNHRLARNVSHAGKIIRDLQDLGMSLRMVPMKGTFQKMARLVRDLARKSGKSVEFVIDGEETEIDRNMVEGLGDPLVHMIRNSVDHGIESAEDRVEAGKNPTGTVSLRAYQSAGNVVIELRDDGKGLDRDRIVAKAVERGLIGKDQEISDNEAFNLIFLPGFSTAAKVTDVSGRGVGMDVVRKSLEALRGRVDLTSVKGKGTTFSLRLPLTMAITDGMLLGVGDERYILPTISIEQSFRPVAESISTVIGRGEVVMLRGDLLPVFRLHRLFNVSGAKTEIGQGLLIVIEGDDKRCAIMVDEILGQQQVVIKSLGRMFGTLPGVSGGAILDDGNVGLILDAAGLINLAHENTDVAETANAA